MYLHRVMAKPSFNLYFVSDTQIGNLLVYEKGIQEMIARVLSDKDAHVIFVGDCIDGIMMNDKRFYDETANPVTKAKPLLEAKYFIELFKPIAHKMDVILWGNHDKFLWRFGNLVKDEICSSLGVAYGGYVSKIQYVDTNGNPMFKAYAAHGRKGISSTADDVHRRRTNKELILKRHLQDMAGDCIIMVKGHNHQLLSLEPTPELYLTDDGEELVQNYTRAKQNVGPNERIHPALRFYGCSGSFLRSQMIGVDSYVEEAELPPVVLGYLMAHVRDREVVRLEEITV